MTDLSLPRVASRLFDVPLMIYEPRLEQIIKVLEPKLVAGEPMAAIDRDDAKKEVPSYIMDGVAVLPIHGSLVRRSGWINAASGLTSYEAILVALTDAIENPSVDSILLDIDSGGGEVSGCFDLVDTIHSLRGIKPIWAIANECACSAAYAIASAADRVVLPRTAILGSIGVLIAHIDQSGADKMRGLHYSYVTAGSKKAAANPHKKLNAEGREVLQYLVNQSYEVFVETVARNRSISSESVRETEAGIFSGEDAVFHGLADAVMNFDEVLEELISSESEGSVTILNSNGKKGNAVMTPKTLKAEDAAISEDEIIEDDEIVENDEDLEEDESEDGESEEDESEEDESEEDESEEDELVPEDSASAYLNTLATVTETERHRASAILEKSIKLNIDVKFAQKLISDGVALEAAIDQMIDKKADSESAGGMVSSQPLGGKDIDPDLPIEDQCEAEWKRDPKLREEFGALSTYIAYRKNSDPVQTQSV